MASTGIALDAACLMAVALEGIVYGFSVLLFVGTMWTLTWKQRMQDVNRPIAIVAILLLIISTAHIVVNIIRVEDGLVKYRDTYPGGPVAFFADPSQPTLSILHALYILQTLLADGVVIYRCYVVWQSILVVILPCMLWCSVAVTGVFVIYSYSAVTNITGDFFANVVGQPTHWVTAFFASTMSTNLLSSGLLVYRIWTVERNISTVRTTRNTLIPILRMLVDAAVLYTVVLFIALVLYLCANNGEEPAVDMIMPIISIAFYMVLIRLAINRKNRSLLSTIETTIAMEQGNSQQSPRHPLRVHVSKYAHSDSTSASRIPYEDQQSSFNAESGKGSMQS
ncbi:uncharacterized protein EDB93DRAFT_1092967 [Suillus bovinus]|uniref:uncharacterized protein n=1 Tax=Suillus bovinus TaxID=48563 RepID=UPI001B86ACCD|nr:uncharacterized protein EDB93DRAFT_1092967 [Suillus bovinus]KAG2134045.1 hypothetical protein EDB93DRAFT_1092967 [Suillus bovinus]